MRIIWEKVPFALTEENRLLIMELAESLEETEQCNQCRVLLTTQSLRYVKNDAVAILADLLLKLGVLVLDEVTETWKVYTN